MTRSVLIHRTPMRIRAARLENDVVVRLAYDFENRLHPARTMLYRVKVTKSDKRMNAAFCDMGNGLSGFLRREGKLPSEGSTFIAEVRREGVGDKGPDLSDTAILRTPFATMKLRGEPRAGVFAHACEDDDLAAVTQHAAQLEAGGPLGPVDPRTPIMRIVMELAEGGIDELLVTSGELAAELDSQLQGAVNIAVTDIADAQSAFDAAEDDALSRTISLAGGGRLVIDQTEALTAIDLDLGRQSGQSQKGAASRLLSDALAALGRYLLLAKIGGQIVIDVPRGAIVSPKIARDQIAKALRPLGRVSVPAVTPEGICIVIAPKPEPTLLEKLGTPDPSSLRHGWRYADDVLAAQAYEKLEDALIEHRASQLSLELSPQLSPFFAEGNKAYQFLTATYGARFLVTTSAMNTPEAFSVIVH